eukprot:6653865-Alexandrium_andersonii.AAC.1
MRHAARKPSALGRNCGTHTSLGTQVLPEACSVSSFNVQPWQAPAPCAEHTHFKENAHAKHTTNS